jgi:hypothetical protein
MKQQKIWTRRTEKWRVRIIWRGEGLEELKKKRKKEREREKRLVRDRNQSKSKY